MSVFEHSWASCILLTLGILASAGAGAFLFRSSFPFAGRISAFLWMLAVVGVYTAPPRFIDRVQLDSEGISVRHFAAFRVVSVRMRWSELTWVRSNWGRQGFKLHLYGADKMKPVIIRLEKDMLQALEPELKRICDEKKIPMEAAAST